MVEQDGGELPSKEKAMWSLITVTYNSSDAIKKHWAGDFGNRSDVEWIVVDNASTDDTVEVAKSLGAKVVANRVNQGFSAANNLGYRESRGTHVAFVNPDVEIMVEDLARMAEFLDGHPRVLAAPQLVNMDSSLQPNGRGWPFLTDKILHRVLPRAVASRYRLYAKPGELRQVVWATGAVVLGQRSTFDELHGPWDDHFFLYYEDSDVCLRARAKGIPTVVLGDVRWVHEWARETTGFRFLPWKREFTSMVKFYARYPRLVFTSPWPEARRRGMAVR
ncbi:glycosyltransferase [Pseudoclavibacter caeni]|nr:glycosyltransferase [Pseudoclavibacter caeni]